MKMRSLAAVAVAFGITAAGGAAFAPAASAANGDCPGDSICLFENVNFQGDAFMFPVSSNGNSSKFFESDLSKRQFPDGKPVGTNVSSVKNNSPIDIQMFTGKSDAGSRFIMKARSNVPVLSKPFNDGINSMDAVDTPSEPVDPGSPF